MTIPSAETTREPRSADPREGREPRDPRDPRESGEPRGTPEAIQCKPVEVVVGDRGLERAIKHLKRKMANEGILRELKRRRHYMKPSVKRRKKEAEAARRRRKRIRQLASAN
jgi:small subunit ribosomal protein S21